MDLFPNPVIKIIKEAGKNYCYLTIKNTSDSEPCEIALESPSPNKYLKLISTTPTLIKSTLNPLQAVEVKFEVVMNPTTPCPAGTLCKIDQIRVRARWVNNDEQHEDVDLQWSNPVTQGDCWLSDGGSTNGHYTGLLCNHLQPDNSSGGPTPDYTKINDITNPNSFPILVRINNHKDRQSCLSLQNYDVTDANENLDWVTIQPYNSYFYGQKVIANFPGGGCSVNPASMIVKSADGVSFDGIAKWVKIRVSYK